MAVATPVLEREPLQKQQEMSADELHNSQISENYKRLINPELTLRQVRSGVIAPEKPAEPAASQPTSAPVAESVRTAAPSQPYLVQNARADSDIFRADSPVNMRRQEVVAGAVEAPAKAPVVVEEEEDEDLRPTMTTIQYRTRTESGYSKPKAAEESESAHVLGKREKVIIATFISVVVALFILVIVNSAVIAGLNSELAVIEGNVAIARQTLQEVTARIDAATSAENIALFAQSHGLILS